LAFTKNEIANSGEIIMRVVNRNPGFTVVELIIAIVIVSILTALLLAAVQKLRNRSLQTKCLNQLRQLGLAFHAYHDANFGFPVGHRSVAATDRLRLSGWTISLLPYIEQTSVYSESLADYQLRALPFHPSHRHLSTVIVSYTCPADSRTRQANIALRSNVLVGSTSFLGVSGRDYSTKDGVLFQSGKTTISEIVDGTSNTLLLGERPPTPDFQFGWWYAGTGQRGAGSGDTILGVREQNILPISTGSTCGSGAYSFRLSHFDNPCGLFHFWSTHTGGAIFLFSDGSSRLLLYSASAIMVDLSTRAGNEFVSIP
jgi:prepilin-type N-terminal cleavage/methylation domain-containing protein